MVAYVVHFPHRTDREKLFLQEAADQNFEFEFVEPIHNPHAGTSLRLTYQSIIKNHYNDEEIIMMEDDVKFCGHGAFQYFLNNKPDSFDVYLSGFYDGRMDKQTKKIIRSWSGTHCWIIRKQFYDTVLSCDDRAHIDRWMFMHSKDIFSCYPFAAIQHHTFSDVSKTNANHKWYIKDKLLFSHNADTP